MSALHKLIAFSAASLLAASCGTSAAAPAKVDEHSGHHPTGAASAPTTLAQEKRMKAMREMRDKMAAATTAEERQALMADHMKAMQEGMQTMKGMRMHGMGSMGGTSGMAAMTDPGGKQLMGEQADAKGMPAEAARQHEMMEGHMEMMQTMLEMMMQRMPAAAAVGK